MHNIHYARGSFRDTWRRFDFLRVQFPAVTKLNSSRYMYPRFRNQYDIMRDGFNGSIRNSRSQARETDNTAFRRIRIYIAVMVSLLAFVAS